MNWNVKKINFESDEKLLSQTCEKEIQKIETSWIVHIIIWASKMVEESLNLKDHMWDPLYILFVNIF